MSPVAQAKSRSHSRPVLAVADADIVEPAVAFQVIVVVDSSSELEAAKPRGVDSDDLGVARGNAGRPPMPPPEGEIYKGKLQNLIRRLYLKKREAIKKQRYDDKKNLLNE